MTQKRIPKPLSARARVLDAARAAFAARGFNGCAIRDIAHRARVNEVTVFRLFGSKENLYEQVLEANPFGEVDVLQWLHKFGVPERSDEPIGIDALVAGIQKAFDPTLTRLFFFAALERPGMARKTISPRIQSLCETLGEELERRNSNAGGVPWRSRACALVALVMYDRIFNSGGRGTPPEELVAQHIRSLVGLSPGDALRVVRESVVPRPPGTSITVRKP